jgi:hypothetical protein
MSYSYSANLVVLKPEQTRDRLTKRRRRTVRTCASQPATGTTARRRPGRACSARPRREATPPLPPAARRRSPPAASPRCSTRPRPTTWTDRSMNGLPPPLPLTNRRATPTREPSRLITPSCSAHSPEWIKSKLPRTHAFPKCTYVCFCLLASGSERWGGKYWSE